ncbi:MAG: hypothetical protein EOO11_11740 [Chitinophagaceae bacterium]|nr:MAG: hypothetical protein EOO11_11740 [Chitinophagaceae bacterium]
MKKHFVSHLALLALLAAPVLAGAQSTDKEFYGRPSYWRPYDQRGINVFETSKAPDTMLFEGPRVRLGAGFTQTFQSLKHKNSFSTAAADPNRLYPMTPGFNTASANLNLDIQLADGIRLNVVTYLSSRHHNEAWVKGGYIQFDKLPFKGAFWNKLMENTTIRIGHTEINYGDQHFRRTDGGQALYNPFIENYIADAFTTEIGGEVYYQKNGLFGMVGASNGMIKGNVDSMIKTAQDENVKKSPALYAKGGFDKSLGDLRVRGTVSVYHNGSSGGNTLYAGDRTGSHYLMAMEKAGGSYSANFTSGRFAPGFSKKVDALMVNGFLKFKGVEVFGTYEQAKGRSKTETADRKMTQLAGDVIYRFGKAENLFAGARYNTVKAALQGVPQDVKIERLALAAGWFLTKNVLLKAEIVDQKYKDFPVADYRNGGKFNGYVIEAVVGF